eukprot:2837975-Rhodomonas_salina.1
MTANIGFLPATAREFVNVTEAYGLGDLETVIETDDMMEFTMMYSESVAKRPTLLLLSMDGSNDAHVVREAQRFFTLVRAQSNLLLRKLSFTATSTPRCGDRALS